MFSVVEVARENEVGTSIMTAMQLESQPQLLNRGRPTKFTPERIQQICNLVERGKSRDEIAGIIGVTTGTLQVTCSKLGISLRRPTFDNGTGLLSRQRSGYQKSATPNQPESTESESGKGPDPISDAKPTLEAMTGAPPSSASQRRLNDQSPAAFAIRMEYKGQERSTRLPLDEEMIGQLAMEAEIRGMRMGELIAALILAIAKKDLFQLVRHDAQCSKRPAAGAESPPTRPSTLGG
jgi:hypothetical protein